MYMTEALLTSKKSLDELCLLNFILGFRWMMLNICLYDFWWEIEDFLEFIVYTGIEHQTGFLKLKEKGMESSVREEYHWDHEFESRVEGVYFTTKVIKLLNVVPVDMSNSWTMFIVRVFSSLSLIVINFLYGINSRWLFLSIHIKAIL